MMPPVDWLDLLDRPFTNKKKDWRITLEVTFTF